MTYALARTTKLKVGTSVAVLPGRHPVLVAKQLASLAALAPKRVGEEQTDSSSLADALGKQPAREVGRRLCT